MSSSVPTPEPVLSLPRLRLPDWLNPWWTLVTNVETTLGPTAVEAAITEASGRFRGPLGRPWFSRALVVFRRSHWHYQPWVLAKLRIEPRDSGSTVTIRIGRSTFQAAFITLFAVMAIAGPIVFLAGALAFGGPENAAPWWTFPLWVAQDAGIYAAVMAGNSAFARRDATWLVDKLSDVIRFPGPRT